MAGLDLTSCSFYKKLDTTDLRNRVTRLRDSLTGLNSLESVSESLYALELLLDDIFNIAYSLKTPAKNDINPPQEIADRLSKVYYACGMLIRESALRLKLLKKNRELALALEHIDEESGLAKRCKELRLWMEAICIYCSVIDILPYAMTTNENATPHETLAIIERLHDRISLTKTEISHLDFDDDRAELRRAMIIAESALETPTIHKHFIIPRRPSSIYTRREEDVMIKAAFEDKSCFSQKRFVLFGMGGSGKTELALKYAEDFRQLFWGVFLIDGSSRKRVSGGYSDIARTVGIEPNEDSAKKWLALQNMPWLLIIDDVDPFGINLEDILPAGRNGCILLTSRSPRYNRYGTAGKKYMGVRRMAEEEAIHLVLKAAAFPTPWSINDKKSARGIAKAVDSSPLALVAAGNAVKHGICSLTDYLTFHKRHSSLIISHRRKLREHHELVRSLHLGDEYTSIITPFEILYLSLEDDKQQSSKDAVEILNILSYMHFGHIYLEFLPNAAFKYPVKSLETNTAEERNRNLLGCFREYVTTRLGHFIDSVSPSASSPLPLVLRNDERLNEDEFEEKLRVRLDRAINVLLQRSLIMIEEGENRYCMHPSVHRWIRERPSVSTAEQAYWCGITTAILARNVSVLHYGVMGDIKDVDVERELLHHIDHVDDCRKAIEMRLEKNRLARRSFLSILGISLKRQKTGEAELNRSHPEVKPVETESYTKMVSTPDPFVLYKIVAFIFLWVVLWIGLRSSINQLLVPLLPSYKKHLIKYMTSNFFFIALILTVTNKPNSASNSNINISKDYFKGSNSRKPIVSKREELLAGSSRRSWENNSHPKEDLSSHRSKQESVTFTSPSTLPHLLDSMLDIIPFLHSEPQLFPGQTRIRWTCECGAKLFDDFVEIEPGSLRKLQDSLQGIAQKGAPGKNNPNTYILQDMRERIKRGFDMLNRAFSTTQSLTNNSALPLHHQATSLTSPPSPPRSLDLLHVLFCIHTGETGLRLHQERIPGITSDRELLLFLRKEYLKYRKVTSWLTLRSVTGVSLARFMVDSSEFAEVHRHAHVCTSDCVCLPPVDRIGSEYNCRPAPEVKPKYAPPIGPRYLSHHFSHPDCIRPTQKFIYNQLPKRTCGQLQAPEDRVEFGWGVYFEEGWHWRSIYFVIVVLIASGSGVFGVTWSVTKGDIQGGFAVSSLWVTLGSLFLGYIAVRSF